MQTLFKIIQFIVIIIVIIIFLLTFGIANYLECIDASASNLFIMALIFTIGIKVGKRKNKPL